MVNTICSELESRKFEFENTPLNSIYFGGGTPSLLKQPEMAQILNTIELNYDVNDIKEVTLEANPDDITDESLRFWKELGISRLSIGIQSFRESDLKWMNRAHNVHEAETCVDLAKSYGFNSFSVDLIYGLPNLSLKEWQKNIQNVIDYGVDHISAYCLTVEERTALAKKVNDGDIIPADEDHQAEQFQFLVEHISKAGYEQYEVSNFCKPDKEAVHNTSYWKGIKYIGVGPSAHSFDGSSRRFNIPNNALYMKKLSENEEYFEVEHLTIEQKFNELLLTGLRTKWGVSLRKLTDIQIPNKEFIKCKNDFIAKNWIKEENGNIMLQNEGWLMADFIASELFL